MPTIQYFAKVDKERTLSPSTIFGWKESYIYKKRKHDEEPKVKEIPSKKCGHPLLIGEQLDNKSPACVCKGDAYNGCGNKHWLQLKELLSIMMQIWWEMMAQLMLQRTGPGHCCQGCTL